MPATCLNDWNYQNESMKRNWDCFYFRFNIYRSLFLFVLVSQAILAYIIQLSHGVEKYASFFPSKITEAQCYLLCFFLQLFLHAEYFMSNLDISFCFFCAFVFASFNIILRYFLLSISFVSVLSWPWMKLWMYSWPVFLCRICFCFR